MGKGLSTGHAGDRAFSDGDECCLSRIGVAVGVTETVELVEGQGGAVLKDEAGCARSSRSTRQ